MVNPPKPPARSDPNLDLGDDDLHNCQDQLAPVGIVPVIFYGMLGNGRKMDGKLIEMVWKWFGRGFQTRNKWLHMKNKWGFP